MVTIENNMVMVVDAITADVSYFHIRRWCWGIPYDDDDVDQKGKTVQPAAVSANTSKSSRCYCRIVLLLSMARQSTTNDEEEDDADILVDIFQLNE